MKDDFGKELIHLFAEHTLCDIQHGGCPCNTCVHSIEGVDFKHVCWLILLGLRGDYDKAEIIKAIKAELEADAQLKLLVNSGGKK